MDGFFGGHSVGEQFSNKELLSYAGLNKFRQHLWHWKCLLCSWEGNPMTYSHLSRTSRCQKCTGQNAQNWNGVQDISRTYISSCKNGAKRRGYEWQVSDDDLWNQWLIQNETCALSGIKLIHGVNASLDRIDNSIGYVKGNIQWVDKQINKMKSDFDQAEFKELCRLVAEN